MAGLEVSVRMYKRILGDCFLIMARRDGRQENILIDCGVLQGVPGDRALMQAVADDIIATTGASQSRAVIHMLAVTHEHWDHISGFGHARDTFLDPAGPLDIEQLWLAWTEKEGDGQADQLREKFTKSKRGVAAADAFVKRLNGDAAELAELDGLENFVGPVDEALAVAGGRMTGRRIMEGLKEKVGPDRVEYLEPGEVRTTPGPTGLRAYVLGPPRKADRLFNDLPKSGPDQETYLRALNLAAEAFALSLDTAGSTTPGAGSPFSKRQQGLTREAVDRLLAAGPSPAGGLFGRYLDPAEEHRRIDDDWAGAAAHLALKLDSDTNNTSLVLAFELGDEPGQGDVLVFAADAQVGNWLSWHDQKYPADAERNKAGVAEIGKVTAESLLNRTVLYKVGHHASHNATLKDRGLELMTDDRLVAMIPVVKAVADTKKGWHMPYPPLLKRLVAKTRGRVLRGDSALGEGLGKEAPAIDEAFAERVTVKKATNPVDGQEDELWVEYKVA